MGFSVWLLIVGSSFDFSINLENKYAKVRSKITTIKYCSRITRHSSIPPGIAIHKPAGRALVGQVTPSPAVVTDHQGAHAIPAHVPQLMAVPTNNISITMTTAATPTTSPLSNSVGFRTLSSNMPGHIACVAYGIVWTITCQVTCFPAIVTSLLVRTVGSKMTLLIAVVAQSHVPRWHCWCRTLSSTMPSLTTRVADALVWAVASHVASFPAVPAQ